MTLKTLSTGSQANCYILTADNGEHLILDMGLPIADIKRGLDYDIEHVVGGICTHEHFDHSRSVNKLKKMGITVFQPYLYDAKRLHTKIGCFDIQSFDVPHSVDCRAFIIKADGLTFMYASDFEFIGYDLSKQQINVMLIEMNYQMKIMDGLEVDKHIAHTVRGHASDVTTTEFILHNQKYLQTVILCHPSQSGNLDKKEALAELKSKLPEFIDVRWATPNEEVRLGCPF